ncbi:2-hydroxymuconate semialdehyde hydrolase [Mycobacterium basiliense]|uniref:2-hydroxymuconate semialdehyde hydrolase n=1 Tax=Mycobacterium basiliense TaxID=2094119 RepID=A0A3S4BWN4_9MYCO|nr:adenylate/guanylate cyclase domain-containing protein [Mycobacterium basiliense]VDM89117.1 2-hydroxymuconate semialdehyde hydrolase [Mycobacterium basiliense]
MSDRGLGYARNGDVRLAYRVFGESGPTVVWAPGWMIGNVDTMDHPDSPYARLIELMSQITQFVVWDRRGTGLSDPATHLLSLDERMDDLSAVLHAVGGDRPTLVGSGEGGAITLLFAATFPEGLRSLVLWGTAARYSQDLPDFPWGFTPAELQAQLDDIDNHWGEGALFELFHGEASDVAGAREMFGKLQRSTMSPAMAKLWWRALTEVDVRGVLRSVRTPTLVLARPGDRLVPAEAAAALAADLPHAEFHSLPPGPHNGADIIDELVSHTLNFVCDTPSAPTQERVLKTVMFTDIVGSTEKLSARGDAHWRHQLDNHDRVVDYLLSRYGGIRANHTGDGIFALFDAPTRAVRCALDLVPALATRAIPIRVGVHTGECERRGPEWSGMAVHTGARIGALAGAGEVFASRTVRDLSVGSGLVFENLGPHRLKGLPEEIDVCRVTIGN